MKIYCDTKQFPTLPFCGPHPKPHGDRGSTKNYNLISDQKLGHGISLIFAKHVPVLHVQQCLKNLGFMLYHKKSMLPL